MTSLRSNILTEPVDVALRGCRRLSCCQISQEYVDKLLDILPNCLTLFSGFPGGPGRDGFPGSLGATGEAGGPGGNGFPGGPGRTGWCCLTIFLYTSALLLLDGEPPIRGGSRNSLKGEFWARILRRGGGGG